MTRRDRRALVVGAAVAAAAILLLRVGPAALQALAGAHAGLEQRAALLARMRAELADTPRLEQAGAAVRRQMDSLAPLLLTGRTPTEAGADLAARVSVLAERHRVRVTRTDPLPDSALAGGLGRVGVRASVESDSGGLLELLRGIAADPTLLVVDGLRADVGDPRVPSDRAEIVRGEISLHGWYLQPSRRP